MEFLTDIIQIINSDEFLTTLSITFKLAFFTTLILTIIGLPLSAFISYKNFPLKTALETILTLPIVLPPTVLGFYYLILFSPDSPIGKFFLKLFNLELVFSFEGIVLASVIYNIPFMIQPLQNGFKSIPYELIEASYTLGKGKLETFFKIILPNMKNAILTAMVLTFAHTIGEFGVVLMVGGEIEGETLVASIAIYNKFQALEYKEAHIYALILLTISFLAILTINYINKRISQSN
jgi:molybdate transport system permease protein